MEGASQVFHISHTALDAAHIVEIWEGPSSQSLEWWEACVHL